MLNIKRFSQRSSSHVQSLLVLSITATLALTLGAVTGPVGRLFVQTPAVVDQASHAARVAPATNVQPAAAAVLSEAAAMRVPYEAGWELYDGGWAGGPAFKMPAVVRVPYEMGWELYDGGYAGGPNTLPVGFQATTVAPATSIQPATSARSEAAAMRVPYEAGWELYDGGWAGGPAFKMPTVARVPYEMGWELYDGGWAGGPNTYPAGMTNQ